MTEAQRMACANAVKGLLVYQNDGTEGFYYQMIRYGQITVNHSANNFADHFLILINGAKGNKEPPKEDDRIEISSDGDQVFIKTDESGEMQGGVYNLPGQQVLHRNLSGLQDLTGFPVQPTGFCLITVRTEKALVTKKVYIR